MIEVLIWTAKILIGIIFIIPALHTLARKTICLYYEYKSKMLISVIEALGKSNKKD